MSMKTKSGIPWTGTTGPSSFSRPPWWDRYDWSFWLPKDIHEDAIAATDEDGVPEITRLALVETARATTIHIEA